MAPQGTHRLYDLVLRLSKTGFIIAHSIDMEHVKKSDIYHGICRHPHSKHFRRLELRVYPAENFAFALLHFTGSDIFERSLRLHAKNKGYLLNDRGIFPQTEIERVPSKSLLHIEDYCDESKIFEFLGLPYKSPSERDGYDHDTHKKLYGHTKLKLETLHDI